MSFILDLKLFGTPPSLSFKLFCNWFHTEGVEYPKALFLNFSPSIWEREHEKVLGMQKVLSNTFLHDKNSNRRGADQELPFKYKCTSVWAYGLPKWANHPKRTTRNGESEVCNWNEPQRCSVVSELSQLLFSMTVFLLHYNGVICLKT